MPDEFTSPHEDEEVVPPVEDTEEETVPEGDGKNEEEELELMNEYLMEFGQYEDR